MARLDRLGAAKELAQLGSVIGREFSVDMLRVILPQSAQITRTYRGFAPRGWRSSGPTMPPE